MWDLGTLSISCLQLFSTGSLVFQRGKPGLWKLFEIIQRALEICSFLLRLPMQSWGEFVVPHLSHCSSISVCLWNTPWVAVIIVLEWVISGFCLHIWLLKVPQYKKKPKKNRDPEGLEKLRLIFQCSPCSFYRTLQIQRACCLITWEIKTAGKYREEISVFDKVNGVIMWAINTDWQLYAFLWC